MFFVVLVFPFFPQKKGYYLHVYIIYSRAYSYCHSHTRAPILCKTNRSIRNAKHRQKWCFVVCKMQIKMLFCWCCNKWFFSTFYYHIPDTRSFLCRTSFHYAIRKSSFDYFLHLDAVLWLCLFVLQQMCGVVWQRKRK